jgi:hypothetical protein
MEGARQDGFNVPSLEKEGIYRIWEVHEQNANDAKAYAERWAKLWPMPKNKYEGRKKYSEYFSNTTFTESWNCASYAEKVLRSGGLNVSAGFFVTSPLELTTGQSRLMRFFNKTRKGSKDDWYLKSPPKSSAPRA